MRGEFIYEPLDIINAFVQYIMKDFIINIPVNVDQPISESCHLFKFKGEVSSDYSLLLKNPESIRVTVRSSEPVHGYYMVAQVDHGLYADDEKILRTGDLVYVGNEIGTINIGQFSQFGERSICLRCKSLPFLIIVA